MTTPCTAKADVSEASPMRVADVERRSRRVSRWLSILYLVTLLAAPALICFGPDVLSPTVPAIANAALDGRFALDSHALCNATGAVKAKMRC